MTEGSPGGARDYVFDRTRANEERRLEKQSAIMDPFTDRLFGDAGMAEGMRVLDLGSGAGDIALLAGRIVGPAGAVVGVEGSAVAIETARRRAAAAGLHHVTFVEGDLRELDRVLDPRPLPFDAVVGRFVLQFVPDPSAVLRTAAAAVRPGGLVCFQECDDHYTYAYPATPLWDQLRTWLLAALDHFLARRTTTEEFLKTHDDLRDHAEFSPLGKDLDAYEWILFIGAHSERHTKQILEVKADPNFPKQ